VGEDVAAAAPGPPRLQPRASPEGAPLTDPPGSPRAARLAAPSWLDTRLVLGVLLVLVSVVVGARVLAAADRSQLVWTTSRALAPGTPLTTEDVVATPVRLFGNAERYLSAEQPPPVGYVLSRGLGADELLPRDALAAPGRDVDVREVTVNVRAGSAPPDLRRGEQIDVYVTPERPPGAAADAAVDAATGNGGQPAPAATSAPATGARLVLSGVTVLQVPGEQGFGAGSEQRAVVLQVRPQDVATVLSATELGRLDLVRVPAGLPTIPTAVAGAG
jgi:hypothetical protein